MSKANYAAFIFLMCSVVFSGGCSSKEEVTVPADVTAAIEAQDSHEEKLQVQEEIIRRQKLEIERQDRELEDLKRQQFYNESYRRYEKRKSE